jgi:hypothetical protein
VVSTPFQTPVPFSTAASAAAGSDSRPFSLPLILAIAGGIFALALAIGFLLCRFRKLHHAPSSSSDEAPDIDFVESTLHETLVTFSDSVTIEGGLTAPLVGFESAPSSFLSHI